VNTNNFSTMIVFKDVISGDEMMTDAFAHKPVLNDDGEEVPGLFMVESSVTIKGADNVDIGCGNAFGDAVEEDDSVEKVNNVIDPFKYTEVPFSARSEFKEYMKDYVKKLRSTMKEQGVEQPKIKEFMSQAPEFVKFLMSKFDDLQFYSGETMDPEACMAYSIYPEGATTPNFMYISAALVSEKF
jgi:hypothetical protein